jgi:hypothetical protein
MGNPRESTTLEPNMSHWQVSGAMQRPWMHSCAQSGVLQSGPDHPISHEQVLGRVQLPLLGQRKYSRSPEVAISTGVVGTCEHTGMEQSLPAQPAAHLQTSGETQVPTLKQPPTTTVEQTEGEEDVALVQLREKFTANDPKDHTEPSISRFHASRRQPSLVLLPSPGTFEYTR